MKARDFTLRKYLSSLSPRKYLSSLYIYTVLPALLLDRERRQKESSREGFDTPRRSFWPATAAADANGLAIALALADDRLGPGSEPDPQRQPITMLLYIRFVSFRFFSFRSSKTALTSTTMSEEGKLGQIVLDYDNETQNGKSANDRSSS